MNDKFSLLKKMRRLSGILVHPTSLPGKFGVGDLGPEAYRFVDFLQEAGQIYGRHFLLALPEDIIVLISASPLLPDSHY